MKKKPYLIKRNRPDDNTGVTKVFGWAMLAFLLFYLIYTTISVFSSDTPPSVEKKPTEKQTANASSTTTTTSVSQASTLEIVGNIVNVRSAPEVDGSNVIIRLKKGEVVKLLENKDGWFKVTLDDGRTGYIKSDPTIAVPSSKK